VNTNPFWFDSSSIRWPVARLKDHIRLVNGFPFDSATFNPERGTRLVRIRDLTDGGDLTYFDGPVPSNAFIYPGDLVIGMDGDFNSATWRDEPAGLNQRLCVLRARPSISQRFLSYLVPMPLQVINDLTYFTTVKHLSSVDLLEERIPLPPLAEQEAIADYLDRETARIDALIAAKHRMRGLLGQRWQMVMQHAVSGSLDGGASARRPTTVPWLTDLPANWREGHLKLVATLGTGHTPSRSHPEWWADLTIPWITTGEVADMRSDNTEYVLETREKISEVGMANSSATLHSAGTVVLCRTASAGYSAIMGADMATSQDFATWTCGPLLRPRFLLVCLRAMRQDLLGRLAMGSTHKTIYMPDIESIKVPIPPVDDQDRVVEAAHAQHQPLQTGSPALTLSSSCSPSGARL